MGDGFERIPVEALLLSLGGRQQKAALHYARHYWWFLDRMLRNKN